MNPGSQVRSMSQPTSRRRSQNGSQPESDEQAWLDSLVEKVVGAAYEVSNVLGAGFLEKIYERALIEELSLRGIPVKAQAPFAVSYKAKHIGTYAADLVVQDRLLVEVKCVDEFCNEHLAQCINYLKASGLHIALLINFRHPKVVWRRVVYNL